jgi:1,2-diacylglycerol 3-beta-galactosyltransferase
MVMGGGDGVGGLQSIATELVRGLKKTNISSQMIVICGHNTRMKTLLTRTLPSTDKLNVVVCGFVDRVDQFMSAADCLVTKAGPGTIAESMTRGLPLVISSYLPGQVGWCV